MESSFAQVQREEFISKKLGAYAQSLPLPPPNLIVFVCSAGLQEDLEDMRMEAMHKKRKMAKKRPTRIDD